MYANLCQSDKLSYHKNQKQNLSFNNRNTNFANTTLEIGESFKANKLSLNIMKIKYAIKILGVLLTYSATDNFLSLIHVSDWLKFCCRNSTLFQKKEWK